MAGDWKAAASRAMDRYADGDGAAAGVLWDLLAPPLYAFFMRRVRDREDAQDLLQTTFEKIHAARQHFVEGGDVTPWAYAIARNVWIDSRRRRRTDKWLETEARNRTNGEEDPAPTSEQLVDGKQLGVRMERELAKLPDHYREAFMLVQVDELSIRDAAAVVQCTEAAMKLRAHRSYEALRAALGDEAVCRFGGKT
jgi:RNA polymerase sigma-70 factor (ECF subfamily)